MPVTIRTSKIWIKNQNGTYTSFDAVSDKATSDRIDDINAAAQEVMDRIAEIYVPDDYSEMAQDVADLKENDVAISYSVIDGIAES